MYLFSKVLSSERLLKDEPNLIGRYVAGGLFDGKWVHVRDTWNGKNYKILPNELSSEKYEDVFGNIAK